MAPSGRSATFPAAGALRVARDPALLFPPPDPAKGRPPLHRFDDPKGEFGVRYLATHLRGALVEVLDQFREVPSAEQLLARVSHVEGVDILEDDPAGHVPEKWLGERRVGRAVLPEPAALSFVDVMDEELLADLNVRPGIQAVLVAHPAAFGDRPRLDFGTIQSSGVPARALSQAVAREIYELDVSAAGIRYISRHTEAEECWAVFDDRATLLFEPDPPFLDSTEAEHREAVQWAAGLHRLSLPPIWE